MRDAAGPEKNWIMLAEQGEVMCLATALDDSAWTAPVYYVFIRPGFYFFSNPCSRHIRDALASGRAACAVFEHGARLQDIRGLQMTGSIKAVTSATQAAPVIVRYVKKFHLVSRLVGSDTSIGLDFFESSFHARLYCFIPQQAVYMDNLTGFGRHVDITI